MLRLNSARFAVCLLPFILGACGDNSANDDPRTRPPLVRVAAVELANKTSRTFTGVVVARTQSDLGFRVQGKILERFVDTGQTVKRGQPLMRLDPVDLKLQALAQRKAVDAARARARKATSDEARYRGLIASGAVSAAEYDQIKATADSATADLSAAQAQANVAQNATGYAVLLADSDGVVMETLGEPGQVVSAGQAVIRLARAGQREALVQLPETLRPAIGSEAQATRYGNETQPVVARLRLLSDSADAATRTFEARYVLEGPLANAPLGATVTLQIPKNSEERPVMQVPLAALYDAGKGPGIWRITAPPTTVVWQPVKVLSVGEEAVQVTGDVLPGEQIVALGAHLLHEGEAVRLAEQHDAVQAGSKP